MIVIVGETELTFDQKSNELYQGKIVIIPFKTSFQIRNVGQKNLELIDNQINGILVNDQPVEYYD